MILPLFSFCPSYYYILFLPHFGFCLSHYSFQKCHDATVRKDDKTTDKRADDGVKVLLVISES